MLWAELLARESARRRGRCSGTGPARHRRGIGVHAGLVWCGRRPRLERVDVGGSHAHTRLWAWAWGACGPPAKTLYPLGGFNR